MFIFLLSCGGTIKNSQDTANTAVPSIIQITLTPNVAYTDSTLSVSVSVDSMTEHVEYSYEWFVDNESVQFGPQNTLSGDLYFDKDQDVYVTITPYLDGNIGTPDDSDSLTIRNSPPVAGVVSFFPLAPIPQRDSLQCLAQHPTDLDEDQITTTIQWYRNDQVIGGGMQTTLLPNDTLPPQLIASGDELRCVATFSDGEAEVTADVRTTAFGYTGWPQAIISNDFIGLTINGSANSMLGASMVSPGDIDGDGLAELLIGAPEEDSLYFRGGAVYLFKGSTIQSASGTLSLSQADLIIRGDGYGHRFGSKLLFDGDFDGDDIPDLLIAAKDGYMGCENGNSCLGTGQVYLFTGAQIMNASTLYAFDATLHFEGFPASNGQKGVQTGSGIAFADLDDDGFDDIAISASDGQTSVGEGNLYIFLHESLPEQGYVSILDFDYRVHGSAGEFLGHSLARVHDIDGDHVDDLVIGSASDCSSNDVAYIVRAVDLGLQPEVSPSKTIYSSAGCSQFGYQVASAGLLDGDNRDDILITAPQYTDTDSNQGAAFVVGSVALYSINNLDVEAESYFSFLGASENDRLGSGFFHNVGDVNLDLEPDFLFSAHTSSFFQANGGRVFLALSPDYSFERQNALTSTHQFRPSFPNEQLGTQGLVRDFTGDGLPDIVLSAPGTNGFSGTISFYFSPRDE